MLPPYACMPSPLASRAHNRFLAPCTLAAVGGNSLLSLDTHALLCYATNEPLHASCSCTVAAMLASCCLVPAVIACQHQHPCSLVQLLADCWRALILRPLLLLLRTPANAMRPGQALDAKPV
jgi:hypothetical protein